MLKVKKAVIPAAGLGTRFLPITKTIPKEMLPIVDEPAISLIIKEAILAGIEEIIIINNLKKASLEDYFKIDKDLEKEFKEKNKEDLIKLLNPFQDIKITFVYQEEQKGLGHAILMAKDVIKDEPFAILLGDDIVYNDTYPAIKQLIDTFNKKQTSILGVQGVVQSDVSKYGIIAKKDTNDKQTFVVTNLIEKPNIESAPSNFAILGRYVLTPTIFKFLETQKPGKGKEIQLTDALNRMLLEEEIIAYDFKGIRYDVGDKFGYMKANIDYALRRDDIGEQMKKHLKNI